jgi:hypothetical protein
MSRILLASVKRVKAARMVQKEPSKAMAGQAVGVERQWLGEAQPKASRADK